MYSIFAKENQQYLSEVLPQLPSNCLLDKGLTGCGGTTLEIKAVRDSIILVPNINIVLNKIDQFKHLIGVWGEVTEGQFKQAYKKQKIKKVIATYDSLPKLIAWIGDVIFNYFLLVDEYHILFNYYRFRYKAISYILANYKKFKEFCFMTATPLSEDNVLEELSDLEQIKIEWPQAVAVNVRLVTTSFTSKELVNVINHYLATDCNLHIFVNSINTIKTVVSQLNTDDIRTICSKEAGKKDKKLGGKLKVDLITSQVRRINFYTATAFEGSDIYDPKGRTIVVSDSSISQSLMDISTLFVQICGRLRDSIYKDEVTYICNTKSHRYLQYKSVESFISYENLVQTNAEIYEKDFYNLQASTKETNIAIFQDAPDAFWNRYLNCKNAIIGFDKNLRKIDHQNYIIVNRIFRNAFSVLKSINTEKKFEAHIEQNPYWGKLFAVLPELIIDNKTFKACLKQINAPFNVSYAPHNLGDCFKQITTTENGQRNIKYDFTKLKLLLGK